MEKTMEKLQAMLDKNVEMCLEGTKMLKMTHKELQELQGTMDRLLSIYIQDYNYKQQYVERERTRLQWIQGLMRDCQANQIRYAIDATICEAQTLYKVIWDISTALGYNLVSGEQNSLTHIYQHEVEFSYPILKVVQRRETFSE